MNYASEEKLVWQRDRSCSSRTSGRLRQIIHEYYLRLLYTATRQDIILSHVSRLTASDDLMSVFPIGLSAA